MSDETDTPVKPLQPTISIENEMKRSYLDYAMSVIVSRAIPDLRDGLKPVHRRILYAMHVAGYTHDKPYRKSARVVGDVIGKYHPHGDTAVYDALVRMAQDFSMRVPLLHGQGNFGSMDGDQPAAMRYTEVRMHKVAASLLNDIDKDTVRFQPNYDGQETEPVVLPARYPNLLVNGSGGIAVGMATNIPPHNLGEIIQATLALIDTPSLSILDLMEYVPAPDFPTGATILGRSGAKSAYHTGRGSVIMRAKTHTEEIRKDRTAIVVDEIPYQINKASLVEKIATLAKEKRIEGIAHVQDESDRFGVRIVIELKRDATADVVLNQLHRFTPLQTSFGCNILALNSGRPELLDLKTFLQLFIDFREEVVASRTAFELNKARERAHLLCGLAVAVENVDEVVRLIRASPDPATARHKLMERRWPAAQIAPYIRLVDDPSHTMNNDDTYYMSEAQARAILELRLQRLTAMGVKEIAAELEELAGKIKNYLQILRSRDLILDIIRNELREVETAFATPRKSEIVEFDGDMDDEDLIEREDMVVTVTHGGYIKRTPLADYREQKRGGKGVSALGKKEEDIVTRLFIANTHTNVLFFTTDGMVYKLKVWRLPQGGRGARGKALINIFPIPAGVSIAAVLPVDVPEAEWSKTQVVFATSSGNVRRNELSDFINVKSNGKIAMKLPDNEKMVGVRISDDESDILLTTAKGKAIRFASTDVRVFKGRDSTGVRGIKLSADDHVVSMCVLRHTNVSPEERNSYFKMRRAVSEATEERVIDVEQKDFVLSRERYGELAAREELLLCITATGYGKRTSAHEFRVSGRGGQGVQAIELGRRGGDVVRVVPVEEEDQIMLITDQGKSIRCATRAISIQSRQAGGVRVLNTAENEQVVSVAYIAEQNEDDENGDTEISENIDVVESTSEA